MTRLVWCVHPGTGNCLLSPLSSPIGTCSSLPALCRSQLFCLADVLLAPVLQVSDLSHVGLLVLIGNQAYHNTSSANVIMVKGSNEAMQSYVYSEHSPGGSSADGVWSRHVFPPLLLLLYLTLSLRSIDSDSNPWSFTLVKSFEEIKLLNIDL